MRTPTQQSATAMADYRICGPTAAPSVLGTWAATVVRALDARGFDGRALAARAGIDPSTLDDPYARHPIAVTTQLWRLAVEVTGDACFGLWASRFVTPTTFHALGFAVFASGTLRDAFERFVRYGRFVSDAADIQLRRVGPQQHFTLTLPKGDGRPSDESIDAIMALVTRTARMLSGGAVNPAAVRLERAEPPASAPFRKVFRAPVRFGQDENVLQFGTVDLDRRLPLGNTELAQINDEVMARYLERIGQTCVSVRLRTWLIDQLPSGEPGEAAAARALGMSQRNLQRRLQAEGTTYREALSRTRQELARAYLEERAVSVTEVAFLLGFTDASSFSRAFRRWTGISPLVHSQRYGCRSVAGRTSAATRYRERK